MKKYQAIQAYLNHYQDSKIMIKRIMKWNPKESVRGNAIRLNIHYDIADTLRRRFKLKYKRVGKGGNYGELKKIGILYE